MKILLCGDVSPTVDNRELFSQGDVQALFNDTAKLFVDRDVCIVNLECALTESENPIQKIGPAIKAPLGTAQTLAKLGVTHCSLANNHFFDYGRKGAKDSMEALDAAGIGYTGFGENEADSRNNLVIEKDGQSLCVIAVCEHEYSYALEDRMGSRPFDVIDTAEDIKAAKSKYDRVVVLFHGGKEHCRYPSPRLRKVCHLMAKCGADVILCQHSHCIGCYEEIEGCHILYGQGNFHFGKLAHLDKPGWFDCLAVHYDTVSGEIKFIPVTGDKKIGIQLANETESQQILDAFAARNKQLADGTWNDGWRQFCEDYREQYTKIAVQAFDPEFGERAIERFRHYIDCEAHLDVWKEIFKTWNHTNEK